MWTVLALAAAASGATDRPPLANAVHAALESRFQLMDRDGNGYITANEAPRVARTRCDCLTSAPPQPARSAGWMERFDADGDARVSAEEYLARSRAEASAQPH